MNIDLSKIASLVGRVLAPLTIVTAVMFYYGWQLTRSIYSQFGIHYTLLELTNQDFMLRSLGIVLDVFRFVPVVILGIVIAHFLINQLVKKSYKNTNNLRRLAVLFLGIGGLLMFFSGTSWVAEQSRALAWVFYMFGIILIAYGLYRIAQLANIRKGIEARDDFPQNRPTNWLTRALEFIASHLIIDENGRPRWTGLLLLAAMVTLGAFYSTAFYAAERAEVIVDEFDRTNLKQFSDVIVYSSSPLFLESSNVTFKDLGGNKGYHFRYSGLKLLMKIDDKYFLVPRDWSQSGNNLTIVLPDIEQIRIELLPGENADS